MTKIWQTDDPWEVPKEAKISITKDEILYTHRKLRAAFKLEESLDFGEICL